ncbi:MAG: membrane-bound lytic murein transglycosylase MltF [Gammaproteobacteria bacterium]|nr:MAG: membrane-bound lytic murein transglycosylase MltF [Gammaproteobacteria bacterium]
MTKHSWFHVLLLPVMVLLLHACSEPRNKLDAVKRSGELVVMTLNGPTTYYEGPGGPAGIEYDLAKAFADYLGVKLRLVVAENMEEIEAAILANKIDLVAAGIRVTGERKKIMRFAPPYQQVYQQVVYNKNNRRPRTVRDLLRKQIEVIHGSAYEKTLKDLKKRYKKLKWLSLHDKDIEELLRNVWQDVVDITIADSNIYGIHRQYYPELRVAFNIKGPQSLAWAFPKSLDKSLYNQSVKFFRKQARSGDLARLHERYYSGRVSYFNLTIYRLRVQNRLPKYQQLFEAAGRKYNIDWRLLAAMGYQESYWDPNAISPTGVRGIMMLTNITAKSIGVSDRIDPKQSIEGGARYLRKLIDRMPKQIKGKDRLWMALAAYNVGYYHVQDARKITRKQRGNAHRWKDVKERLPLLSRPFWFQKTKYGYARGYEPVEYVTRIRAYYKVLVKVDSTEQEQQKSDALDFRNPAM